MFGLGWFFARIIGKHLFVVFAKKEIEGHIWMLAEGLVLRFGVIWLLTKYIPSLL